MLLMESFHSHPADSVSAETCAECLHHIPHQGHLSSSATFAGPCLLCHMATVPFCPEAELSLGIFISFFILRFHENHARATRARQRVYSGRAPPVLL